MNTWERWKALLNPSLLDKHIEGKMAEMQIKAETSIENKLHEALYNFYGQGQAIWSSQNSTNYIRNGYQANLNVYAIVSWITRKAAAVPFELVRGKGDDEEIVDDHPVLDLLNTPNDYQGKFEFFEQYYGFRLLTGNTYLYKLAPESGVNTGRPMELFTLPANLVEIVYSGKPLIPIRGYKLTGFWDKEFTAEEIMHSKYANYDFEHGQEWYGMSPIRAALKAVDKSNENFNAGKRMYQNLGANGLLYPKGLPESKPSLTDEQVAKSQKKLDKKIRGSDNFQRKVLVSSELGYLQFGMNADELQLIEDAQMTREDLCNVWHLPVEILNGQRSSGLNDGARQTARAIAYEDAVLPEVQAFCDEFTRDVVSKWGDDIYLRPDTSGIRELQADKVEQAKWLQMSNHLTDNEKRSVQGFEPIEGGDELRRNEIPTFGITDDEGNQKGIIVLNDYYDQKEAGSKPESA